MIVNSSNLISFIQKYFISIGINKETISDFFENNTFEKGLVINLSAVCLMPGNKPRESRSNQTHIHITGASRYFFFSQPEISGTPQTDGDKKIDIDVSFANLNGLRNNLSGINQYDLGIQETFTLTKVSYRHNQESQVQISKIKQDGKLFIDLRSSLYINDLLIILKYKETERYFAVGIPKEHCKPDYVATAYYPKLVSAKNISVKNALKKIEQDFSDDDTITNPEIISDSIFQQQVYEAKPSKTELLPTQKPEKTTSKSTQTKRDPSISKEALADGNYTCSLDSTHATFITKKGFNYIEGHHLIPISKQDDFEFSLDIKANIIPICPNCHALLHYGTQADIFGFLEKMHDERKGMLSLCGIEIDLESLKKYYS